MIGSISAYSTLQSSGVMTTKTASTVGPASGISGNQGEPDAQVRSGQTISPLARQLADSASRAEARDKTLSRAELGEMAKSMLNQIVGDAYYANKARHDSEVPKTSDPELLARAKQATAYLNDASKGGHAVENPFAGLSREQLTNIIYDDSGTYTVNERHAAWREAYEQEEVWRRKVAEQAMDEYNRTGKLTNFFKSVLEYYRELPPIEQAQYPTNYASDLEYKIAQDFNYRTHRAEGKGDGAMSLIEMLLEQTHKQENKLSHGENSSDLTNLTENKEQ